MPIVWNTAPTRTFVWRGWQITVTAYSDAYHVVAESLIPRALDGATFRYWFFADKSIRPAAFAGEIMRRVRRYAAQNGVEPMASDPTQRDRFAERFADDATVGANAEFLMPELSAWTPRLRVQYVDWKSDQHQEHVVNDAATVLEAEGHTIMGFQFETWVVNGNDIQSCCWITYALADEADEPNDL